jgi:hypothetical protein
MRQRRNKTDHPGNCAEKNTINNNESLHLLRAPSVAGSHFLNKILQEK